MRETESLSHWDYAVKDICGTFATRIHPHIPFIGNITLRNHGGLEIAHIETNAERVLRSKLACRDDRYCFLILQTHGVMGFVASNGDELSLAPGDMLLIDSSHEFAMLPQGLIQQLSFHLPREKLRHITTPKRAFHKLDYHSISALSLRGILQQLRFSDVHFGAKPQDAEALQQAIIALLTAALGQPSAPEFSLRDQAEQHIRRLIADHRLCPEKIASEMGISRRSLYRLFQQEGGSIAQHILDLRLNNAAADLQYRGQDALSVTDIAFRWGFNDVSQFSRAFKREMGLSPSAYRQQAQEIIKPCGPGPDAVASVPHADGDNVRG